MAASAPKKSRREDLNMAASAQPNSENDKLNEDPKRRIQDFLTEMEAGRMRSTEKTARGRKFSAYRTKITVPKSRLPLRHLYDAYDDDDDDPNERRVALRNCLF